MRKGIKYYMGLNYPITLELCEDNDVTYYSLEIPDLPGCGAAGETMEDALDKLNESKEMWIKEGLKRKLPIPEPVEEGDFSGKFLLRIPIKLHMGLAKYAKTTGVSLNQYIKSTLEKATIIEREQEKTTEKFNQLAKMLKEQSEQIEQLTRGMEYIQDLLDKKPVVISMGGTYASTEWHPEYAIGGQIELVPVDDDPNIKVSIKARSPQWPPDFEKLETAFDLENLIESYSEA